MHAYVRAPTCDYASTHVGRTKAFSHIHESQNIRTVTRCSEQPSLVVLQAYLRAVGFVGACTRVPTWRGLGAGWQRGGKGFCFWQRQHRRQRRRKATTAVLEQPTSKIFAACVPESKGQNILLHRHVTIGSSD
eukprot:6176579-Pleurochrysis_carterae.AAC.2